MKTSFLTVRDYDLNNKTVLLRADLNVPRQNNTVTDTTRIDRLKATIDYLQSQNAKTLILSHFGRPDGEENPEMSLAFLAPVLEKQWQLPVKFSPQCIGETAENIAQNAQVKDIILLENLRFHKGEKANTPDFVESLAKLGDIYVNDAFSASHRTHASTTGLAHILPSAAGLLMEQELNALQAALETPEKPVLAVTGGSKISTKLNVLTNLIEKVDYLVLGGGMANTFLYAQGYDLGKSLCEKDMKETVQDIMNKAKKIGCEIILPQDMVVCEELKENTPHKSVSVANISENDMAVDIGEQSIQFIINKIKTCKTVVWNGPLGVFEIKPFDNGTNKVAQAVANQTCTSVAGGGDTVAALENANAADQFSYISTAGGAFLEWLEGNDLPGITALIQTSDDKPKKVPA